MTITPFRYQTPAWRTKFREVIYESRLEARWAAYFDLVGWKHKYEPCVFIKPGHPAWTPDFWLPAHRTYVEVKPISRLDDDQGQGVAAKLVDIANAVGLTDNLFIMGNGPGYDNEFIFTDKPPTGFELNPDRTPRLGWSNRGRTGGAVRFWVEDFKPEPPHPKDPADPADYFIRNLWQEATETVSREGIDWRPPAHR